MNRQQRQQLRCRQWAGRLLVAEIVDDHDTARPIAINEIRPHRHGWEWVAHLSLMLLTEIARGCDDVDVITDALLERIAANLDELDKGAA
jgi:hypothetical protein